ncbi:MAG TPA: protein kinase [Chlamydiales bacterium]|nr:protein kinase [Chlamydiales bacterium]
MSVEVVFNPIRSIVLEDENGVINKSKELPPLFKPINWPDVHWVRYNESASPFPVQEKEIAVIDTHTNKAVSVFVDLARLVYVNHDDYQFSGEISRFGCRKGDGFFEKYDQILRDFRSLCEVEKSFQETGRPGDLSRWEELALQIASICVFVPTRQFFCFSMRHNKLPVSGGSISPQGDIFLDLPNSRVGKGATRSFESAIWLNHQRTVAKGVRKLLGEYDKLAAQNEMGALSSLGGNEGIIRTYCQGTFSECGLPTFLVFQEHHQQDLYQFLKRDSLSPQDQQDLIGQLLKGLVKISDEGIHFDIRLPNILVSRRPSGKIKGVISDFGSFIAFANPSLSPHANTELAPPEYHQGKPLTCKLDVWMLGLVFVHLCTKKRPSWLKQSKKDQVQTICALADHWSRPALEKANVPKPQVDLIDRMLTPDSRKRVSPRQALQLFSGLSK